MTSPNAIFVDVDTQRDFLEPSGALFIPGSQAILENLEKLTSHARKNRIPILATACNHTPEDSELELFAPHCMNGTPGQLRVAATCWPGEVLALDDPAPSLAELPDHLTIEKRAFDVFTRPETDEVVARYNQGGPTFVVYGVATDYCVKAVVLGLLQRGCHVVVVADAVRAIDTQAEPDVLSDFIARGAALTLTGVIVADTGHSLIHDA